MTKEFRYEFELCLSPIANIILIKLALVVVYMLSGNISTVVHTSPSSGKLLQIFLEIHL